MIALNFRSAAIGRCLRRDALRSRVWAGAVIVSLPFSSHAAVATAAHAATQDASCAQNESASSQWWLDLSVTPLARVPSAQRKAHLRMIQQEQAQIEQDIVRLGLAVSGRVTHVRNALAVTAAHGQVATLRALPGVIAVRPVSQKNHVNTPAAPGAPPSGCS